MTTRHAACSCGQLHLTVEGEPARVAMCHCLECQRRTGAVISNQARFRRDQITFAGKATEWTRTAESGNVLRTLRTITESHSVSVRPSDSGRKDSDFGRTVVARMA